MAGARAAPLARWRLPRASVELLSLRLSKSTLASRGERLRATDAGRLRDTLPSMRP